MRAVLIYWSKARGLTREDVRRALAQQDPKEGETTMSAIEEWIQEGIEKGWQEGTEQGLQEGAASSVIRLLRARFGLLGSRLEDEIRDLSYPRLEELIVASLDFINVADLTTWTRECGTNNHPE